MRASSFRMAYRVHYLCSVTPDAPLELNRSSDVFLVGRAPADSGFRFFLRRETANAVRNIRGDFLIPISFHGNVIHSPVCNVPVGSMSTLDPPAAVPKHGETSPSLKVLKYSSLRRARQSHQLVQHLQSTAHIETLRPPGLGLWQCLKMLSQRFRLQALGMERFFSRKVKTTDKTTVGS